MSTCKTVVTRNMDKYCEVLDEKTPLIQIKHPKVAPFKSAVESVQVHSNPKKEEELKSKKLEEFADD